MSFSSELPTEIVDLLKTCLCSEFATVSAAGVPIDTPMLIFPSADMSTLDVATGLAYPAKAERARNNPKVGLLYEGGEKGPVVAVAGMAAVRDSDIQANTERYISETAFGRPGNPPWSLARQAVWYWSRIIVPITPVRILWWDSPAALDGAPHRWDAPADTVYPASDPKPPGALSKPNNWAVGDWREQARTALAFKFPAHFTLKDDDGFPLPMRARSVEIVEEGFRLDLPKGAPWKREGVCCLTFLGRETFVGQARADGDAIVMTVERALPINPFVGDPRELWNPSDEVREKMFGRLKYELDRRGQPVPTLPEGEPITTPLGEVRKKAMGVFESVVPLGTD